MQANDYFVSGSSVVFNRAKFCWAGPLGVAFERQQHKPTLRAPFRSSRRNERHTWFKERHIGGPFFAFDITFSFISDFCFIKCVSGFSIRCTLVSCIFFLKITRSNSSRKLSNSNKTTLDINLLASHPPRAGRFLHTTRLISNLLVSRDYRTKMATLTEYSYTEWLL